ncbi:hypothetical protein H072_10503 [Dactylellina haptotyla CBS 200.50]|uniref:DNA polymerase delta subunit 3 n=1 Tax=Dactylellina haptotyla (strain CBS 200.50) TaxID=1284197 RepID=S7ZZ16_DACHA|nr:hypothetical protein H072_10503 [Dactylellina haptotyla CBS 200.50]
MSADYTSFLAARVLNDNKLITYRLLSRELKIHVNKAKEYLAAFHESENNKRKGACHATYVITGVPKPLVAARLKVDKDHDTYMESSPVPEPTQNDDEEVVRTTSVILVAEEQLEETKESLQEVLSIHIYSLEPGPLKDLLVTAEASTELYSRFPSIEPAERSKLYGSTSNKYVKKREGAPPPPPPPPSTKSSNYVVPVKKEPVATPAASTPPAKDTKKEAKDFFGSMKAKEKPKASQSSEPASSAKPKVPLKRGQSDLMSSFSNAQPKKAKQPEKKKTPPPDFMDVDDDEPEEPEPIDEEARAAEAAKQAEIRRKREEDEEKLRQMMDDDDDEPVPTKPMQDSPAASGSPEATAPPPDEEPTPTPSAPPASAPGRRKLKRKITKKVRSKDENGYIVTKEVEEWEEFSEDDIPVPVKPTAKPNAFSAMKQAPGSQKSKKATGEGGGGGKRDIASFFQKK